MVGAGTPYCYRCFNLLVKKDESWYCEHCDSWEEPHYKSYYYKVYIKC